MIEVPVYRPALAAGSHQTQTMFGMLLPYSAIISAPTTTILDDLIVYYEGNKYGYANVVTFADRAMIAYYRMRENAPTIAKMLVPRHTLRRIGTLYPEHGRIEPRDGRDWYALAQYLGCDLSGEVSAERREQVAAELRCSGVRV